MATIRNKNQAKPINKNFRRRLLLLLIAKNIALEAKTLYRIRAPVSLAATQLDCHNPEELHLYSFRVHEANGIPVSLSISHPIIDPKHKYITDRNKHKIYGMYEVGDKCYIHKERTGKNSRALMILVIEKDKMGGNNKCKVTKIISNLVVEPCPPPPNYQKFYEILQFDGSSTPESFLQIKIDDNFLDSKFAQSYQVITGLAAEDIDERIVEMVLLGQMKSTELLQPIAAFEYEPMELANNYRSLNTNEMVTEILPKDIIPRMVVDDLPGYFLGVKSEGPSDISRSARKVIRLYHEHFSGVHVELYIAKPSLLLKNVDYSIELRSIPYKVTGLGVLELGKLFYTIKLIRKDEAITFRVERGILQVGPLDIKFPYLGGAEYIYFSFTVSGGALYFDNANSIQAKYHEVLNVYQVGKTALRSHATFETSTTLSSLLKEDSHLEGHRWAQVDYKPPARVKSNYIGVRVLVLTKCQGAYPPFLVTDENDDEKFPRCYFKAYDKQNCLAMAYLSGPGEKQSPSYRIHYGKMALTEKATEGKKICSTMLDFDRCLSVLPGNIMSLESHLKGPIPFGRSSLEEYDALKQVDKNRMVEFRNNKGTRYLVTCPYSCKLEISHKFSLIQCFTLLLQFKVEQIIHFDGERT